MSSSDIVAEMPDLEALISSLQRDYSKLAPRIRVMEHTITCECDDVRLRVHYPSIRQGNATVDELIDTLIHFLIPFALPRAEITAVNALYGQVTADEFSLKCSQLFQSATRLFKRANEATGRNGECGELLLYLFTEWVLRAPQLLAKMSLKTNRDMPVYGADGVHVRYCSLTSRLLLYWGESKLHADINSGISSAIKSMTKAISPEKLKHELDLVQIHINFSGIEDAGKNAILRFLDPFEESYNQRHDILTCLIGFDHFAYQEIASLKDDQADAHLRQCITNTITSVSQTLGSKLRDAGLHTRLIEIFFFPLPSVSRLRELFQDKIGLPAMIQELSNKVWSNPLFHQSARRIELAWISRELGTHTDTLDPSEAAKLMRAAAILSCLKSPIIVLPLSE